ncbi:MAG TPA: glutamate-1-semialdehyde 2,1-aminomutase [Verrucomicrobiae bacterium]|jgi:glutamate-1-semialdehyde 2,1-aminomutase|nr:glutamate-1-semialdehyde 2,1-aminomutase [Verrucomicrobiae bacterium]
MKIASHAANQKVLGGMETSGSARLFAQALEVIASGVNSTARAPRSGWSPYPLFVDHGKGSRIFDVDGNEFIDYLLGLGPMLLGHCPEQVTNAVVEFIRRRGTVFALPVADEIELARKLIAAVPSVEQTHLANSGTEAVLYALRLARAYTGRKKIIRFEGMYHGFSDAVYWSKHPPLENAGPDAQPVPVPQGPGMPDGLENSLIILQWNDGEILERTIRTHGDQIAAVITEPVMCNTGCILPEQGYLELMRSLTRESGTVLIFDEVITGFRVSLGGAQQYYGVTPDLTVMAKGFGGGFPVAAVGGKKEIMRLVADGTVSMAGTYSGNGIAVSAANATLDFLGTPGIYGKLFELGEKLMRGISERMNSAGLSVRVVGIGPLFQVWFTDSPIRNYRDAVRHARKDLFRMWWEAMMKRGVLFHPDAFENLFISFTHNDSDVDLTLKAVESALPELKIRMR